MKRRLSLIWYAIARGVVEITCRMLWRVEIRGQDRLPGTGAYVIAPVHRSNVDTLLAGCLTHRRIRFMGKDSLWKYRWSGALFSSLGAFPVHRGTPDREALRQCEVAVRGGEPVVLFPEGTRQSGPQLQPLFEGAAFVAARVGVPILPPERAEGARLSRRAVAEMTERLNRELQALFDEAMRAAGRA